MDDDEFVDAREAKDWLTEVMTLNREIRKKDETIKEQKRELNKSISQVKDLEWEMDEKRKEFKRIISQKEDEITKMEDDIRKLNNIKRELKESNVELKSKVEAFERREKEEIDKQNRLAMQRAKSASVEADIKERVRIEEDERCKIRHEIDRKRSLEKEFENFLNYKKNRTQ